MAKILIIGGGGFLGRHLARKLLTDGETVRIFGRRDYPDLRIAGCETVRGEITDAAAVRAAVCGVDAVCHMAAKVGISGRPAEYFRTNVLGTENVIAACRAANVGKLLYTSTPSVVFGRDDIINGDESLPYATNFLTDYAATKAQAEQKVLAANSPELSTCALRPHLIWGPEDTNLIPRIIKKARAGRLCQIGEGKNLVSVSYVENTADAHIAALKNLTPGGVCAGKAYFINEPEPVNCWEFLRKILKTLELPEISHRIPAKLAYALGGIAETAGRIFCPRREPPVTRFLVLQLSKSHYFTPAAAMRDFGWTPAVSIDEGLTRLKKSLE